MEKKYLRLVYVLYIVFFLVFFTPDIFLKNELLANTISTFILGISVGFGLSGALFKFLTDKRDKRLLDKKSQRRLSELKKIVKS